MSKIMNRCLLILMIAFLGGCASAPRSFLVLDGEIESYRARALKALTSPNDWPQDSVVLQFKKREIDRSRKLWYDLKPEAVTVWVPTIEPERRNSFVCVQIDRSSKELLRISLGETSH